MITFQQRLGYLISNISLTEQNPTEQNPTEQKLIKFKNENTGPVRPGVKKDNMGFYKHFSLYSNQKSSTKKYQIRC